MQRLVAAILSAGLAAELVHMLGLKLGWAQKWLIMAPIAFFLSLLLIAVAFPAAPGRAGFWRSNPYGTRFGLPNAAHPVARLVYALWAVMALAWLAACVVELA